MMLGIPREYINLKRPAAMVNWYRSRALMARRNRPPDAPLLPVTAQIEPTVKCDLDCTFCQSRELRKARPAMHMPFEHFERIIKELDFLVSVGLVGMGEPTLHPEFFRMVELADSLGIATNTVTNCNRHSDQTARRLVSVGLKKIAVSIDGASPQTYQQTRIGGDFRRTIANLERLVRLRGSARLPRIEVQMVALESNYDEIPELVRLCARIGVDSLMIQGRPTDWGKDRYVGKTVGVAARTAGQRYEQRLREAIALGAELGLECDDHRSLYDRDHTCPKPWRDVYVSTTGEVVPCCTIADPRVVCLGNLLEQSFREIWNGPRYVRFREALMSDRIPRCCWQCYASDRLVERLEEGQLAGEGEAASKHITPSRSEDGESAVA